MPAIAIPPRVLLGVLVAVLLIAAAVPAAASAEEISGTAYKDLNRDATPQPTEPRLADQELYLYRSDDTYVGRAVTDASGRYSFAGLPDGAYRVEYSPSSWWALRDDWVPTTTGSLRPVRSVQLTGSAAADFGWRAIARSADAAAPISSFTGPSGLRVDSYDDVVAARELYDVLAQGTLGDEAGHVTVRFDFGDGGSWTGTSVSQADGVYTGYQAISYVTYESWLTEGTSTLSHEYGHAWSLYYAHIVQQDPTLAAYIKARGLEGDPRVGSSYGWSPREMIAEDYRQLLGAPSGRAASQINAEIPRAADVPGLAAFLADTFTRPPAPPPPPPAPPLAISSLAMSPSPVQASGTVSFSLSAPASVTVTIETTKGALVRTLLSAVQKPGGQVTVPWDRTDSGGRRVKRGSYRVRVAAVDSGGKSVVATAGFSVG